MLTEKRQEEILKYLQYHGSVTVQELREMFQASESTIRRDLNTLDQMGKLVKVFGGAVLSESNVKTKEEKVSLRKELHQEEKRRIGRYAASLIMPKDFVYLDAGTTTGAMIPFLTEYSAVFVTNAVSHALQLAEMNFKVILIGGEVKSSTEAIIGNEAYAALQKYNFTKGFFGTNAVSVAKGLTTPDLNEAMIKKTAFEKTRIPYVLCDSEKFGEVCPVQFADFADATLLTDRYADEIYKKYKNIVIVTEREGDVQ